MPIKATTLLYGVWGSSPSDVWAVGLGGEIFHWNGSEWLRNESGTTERLRGIWGSGASDLWAVGASGTILRRH